MQEVYLDNSATTRVCRESADVMTRILTENYGNPSSLHRLGINAEKTVEEARNTLARILNVAAGEIFFTSGGTEASNLAIKGALRRHKKRGRHIITSCIEHPATLFACKALEKEGYRVDYLEVDRQGNISLEELREKIAKDTVLVSLMHVNNEIGTILPVAEAGKLIKEMNPRTLFHVDAVQSFCKLPCLPRSWQADLMSISAHKIHGPKGAGALYKREGILLEPLLHGGGQEEEVRPGTENTPGIAGFARAAQVSYLNREKDTKHMADLKEKFLQEVPSIAGTTLIGPLEGGAPHILSLSFAGIPGEVLLHSLEEEGIYASTGSACHSRRQEISHVLSSLKLKEEEALGTLRFSFSRENTPGEVEYALEKLALKVKELREVYQYK